MLAFGAGHAGAESPDVDYMLQCQGCHLADGRGAPGIVPSLEGVGRFLRAPGGRAYLVQVPGSAQAPLSDAALAAVLNWMIGRFGPAEVARDFAAYTAGEVAALRRRPLVEVETTRSELLAVIEGGGGVYSEP